MNIKCNILSLALLVASSGSLLAQSTSTTRALPRSIFEALEGEAEGEGHVVIYQSEAMKRLVGTVSGKYGPVLGREGNTSMLMGYRIQVYSGNQPSSRAEARARAVQIRQLAPEYNSYLTYNAPFWKLVVGDFLTMAQAREVRNKLLSVLPAWGKESYIVKDKVRIINYDPYAEEQ